MKTQHQAKKVNLGIYKISVKGLKKKKREIVSYIKFEKLLDL
jgi:hypothetical protein